MNRLRDMEGDEPLFRRGREVLRRTPSTPQDPEVKLRVWRAIRETPVAGSGPLLSRFRDLSLKAAIVTIFALATGTAGAVIARRWIFSGAEGVASKPTPPRAPTPAPARPERMSPTPSVAPAAVTVDESRIRMPPRRSTPRKVASLPPSAAAVARERTEVLDALIALRREHDPVRAGTMLTRYLSAHPRGALREEALALAIEAADARGDRAGGEQLARVYQSEYPAGRFLQFAQSHTAR